MSVPGPVTSPRPAESPPQSTVAEDQPSYPPPSPEAPRPLFSPFFTLVEDNTTAEHHHPTVHYIFSDDDTDLITEASLRTLSHRSTGLTGSSSSLPSDPNGSSTSGLPAHKPGVKERYVVLDVAPSGDAVVAAHSLTSDWQVLGVDVTNAPTWVAEDENTGGSTAGGNVVGLMLRIEGTEGPWSGSAGKKAEGGDFDMQELTSLFDKRMAAIRRVVEAGGGKVADPS
ncbi:hypothetical protein FGG08_002529 [Glutinoglossum americanum]|uniref:Uncharacterized protein n=1 Tax=Glutinoglossum americanum TaxID=1670608 RepID=A0A9P8L5H5_9PEZI|nr:hypothetical protein FGG08_002529 [Glutinoglossum americanum]